MTYEELPLMDGAYGAVQVWSCPCGAEAQERTGYLQCETCGRTFDDRGRRVITDEDDEEVRADPDADLRRGFVG